MTSYSDYFYPATDTFKNLLGITDAAQLQIAEAEITREAMRRPMGAIEMSGAGLKQIHQHIFRDIYPWAGQFRTVDMVKIAADGLQYVEFAPGAWITRTQIPRFFGELGEDLASPDGFLNVRPADFAYRAAVYLKDLNYIHPFVEGNGRVQRLWLEELARTAGFQLDHHQITRDMWIDAAIESYGEAMFGPHAKMTALIATALIAGLPPET